MSNPRISPPPADLLELFHDPRLDGMEEEFRGLDGGGRTLRAPVKRPAEPSRFLELSHCFGEGPNSRTKWVNEPDLSFLRNGYGMGLQAITATPRIEQYRKRPRRLPQFWFFSGWFVASPRIVELFASHGAHGMETCPIDWVFNDGNKLDGYAFMDVVQLVYGYDYRSSEVHIEFKRGERRLRALGRPRVFHRDLPPDLHYFRDAYHRHDVLVSRELAYEIDALVKDEIRITDPHGTIFWKGAEQTLEQEATEEPDTDAGSEIESATELTDPATEGEQDVRTRIGKQVMPLIDTGRFADADALLTRWLATMPAPFGPAAGCAITNFPRDVAAYLDEFVAAASKKGEIRSLYIEMNAFGINTDRWFFDVFAFSFDGGRDNYGWLGDFFAWPDESFTIAGLEPLQSAYNRVDRTSSQARDAQTIADALVIVRLQRLLAEATRYCKALDAPLLASAHDYGEYVVEIPRE